jgi:hypothetical protein
MPFLSLAYHGKEEPRENPPRRYCELVALRGQPRQWQDLRHLQTFSWMVGGLIPAGGVRLRAWGPFVSGRARSARRTQRRVARWLANTRSAVPPLSAPLSPRA